jgi:excisionase family DNA binding protein
MRGLGASFDLRRPMPTNLIDLTSRTEPYITLEDVARRLGYSTRWVRDRIRRDGLPSHQRGRGAKHRFRWSEVEAWDAARSDDRA